MQVHMWSAEPVAAPVQIFQVSSELALLVLADKLAQTKKAEIAQRQAHKQQLQEKKVAKEQVRQRSELLRIISRVP